MSNPLSGKRSALTSWTAFQQTAATYEVIRGWSSAGLIQNVGLICGTVSRNLVVLDLDGEAGYPAFAATFPHLTDTFTVATGGGVGRHGYFYADRLPSSVKAMGTPIGNLELCAEGRQVVAPPSIHPVTGHVYRVEKPLEILRIAHLDDLASWIEAFKPREAMPEWTPPRVSASAGQGNLNPRLIDAIRDDLLSRGFKPHGEWLHGRCLHPERHRNGDRNPSFGFNTVSGYGHCYVCGTLLAKDISTTLGIDPVSVGGLFEKPVPISITSTKRPRRPPAPPSDAPPTTSTNYMLPKKEAERLALGEQIGRDGITLLTAVYTPTTPVELRALPQVKFLRRAWVVQFYQDDDQTRWRSSGNLPPGERIFTSPYDPDARLSKKRDMSWVGYKVHLTETCDDDHPHLITHVETTLATQADSEVVEPIHTALANKNCLPGQHLVDNGYGSGEAFVSSQQTYGVELFGSARPTVSWQAATDGAYTLDHFQIDFAAKVVT
jgi:hypothetical protein